MKYGHFNSLLDTLRNFEITKSNIALEKIYEKNIPKNCIYKTFEEHKNYMFLCWGLMEKIKFDYVDEYCKSMQECLNV